MSINGATNGQSYKSLYRSIKSDILLLKRYIKDLNLSGNPKLAKRTYTKFMEVEGKVSSALKLLNSPGESCEAKVIELKGLVQMLAATWGNFKQEGSCRSSDGSRTSTPSTRDSRSEEDDSVSVSSEQGEEVSLSDETKLNALYELAKQLLCSPVVDQETLAIRNSFEIQLKSRFMLFKDELTREGRNPEETSPDKTEVIEYAIAGGRDLLEIDSAFSFSMVLK